MASKLNVWILGKTLKYKLIDFMGKNSHKIESHLFHLFIQKTIKIYNSCNCSYLKCKSSITILMHLTYFLSQNALEYWMPFV